MIAEQRDFRLSTDIRPIRYQIHLQLDLETWSASGHERIELEIDRPVHELTLHALELDVQSARLEEGPNFERASYDEESQTVTLHFGQVIHPGHNALHLEWQGPIREALRGLYRSTYGGQRFAATQFESADARRAFPCFDEPEFKARFAVELVHDARIAAIGNGAIDHQEILPDGRRLTRFAETPPISTYLVAFTVGPYESTPEGRTSTGIPVRVWLPPGLADKGKYARQAHERAVVWLEDYTGIPYPYGKLDGIGIPDFEAGAMENPGAITYRTTLLAADPATASTPTFKRIFSVVAHELTHMWWGDLVTMKWWDDLWLNESFASFVGEKCTDALNPEWGYIRDVVSQATSAFNLDQLNSTHPISMQVHNAAQASERFDAITYLKGMAVLRMIESFIGADAFRRGVRVYLNRHAEGNATADDFWRALDEASGQDVSAVANVWIFEPGHPLIACRASATADGLEVELTQSRFFFDREVPPTDQSWLIPIVVKYGTADGMKEDRLLMDRERVTLRLPGATWFYPNAGGRGFYRYVMDDDPLARLAAHVRELAPEERTMLVDNQWALTRAGKADLAQLFELIAGLRGERDRAVLDALSDPISWLETHAVPDDRMDEFHQIVAGFFQPVLDDLGWEVRPQDTTEDKERRARAMSILGRIARVPTVLDEARQRILNHLDGRTVLDPDIASALASGAAVRGDAALFDRYVDRMKEVETTDAQEEARFRNALVAFEDPSLVRRISEDCFGQLIRVQDRGLMLVGLLGSRHARRIAWPIVREHWETGVATLDPGGKHRIISGIGQLTPRDLEAEAAGFIEQQRGPDTEEITSQTLERLRLGADAAERLARELPRALARLQPT